MEKTPDTLTIIDKRHIKPEDVGLDLSINAESQAKEAARAAARAEQEALAPLSLEQATELLTYSDALKGEPAKKAREYAEKNPDIAQALVDLTEKHGQGDLADNVTSIKSELDWRMEQLGLTAGNRGKSSAWARWGIAQHYKAASQRHLAKSTLTGDALLNDTNADNIHEAIINGQLGREYGFSRERNKAAQLSPDSTSQINELLTLNESVGNVKKNNNFIAIGEILTTHINDLVNTQVSDPTAEDEPTAPKTSEADPTQLEASPEKRKKPFWLKRVATSAMLNFRVARQVGFTKFTGEQINSGKDKAVTSFNNLTTEIGGGLTYAQRAVNEKLTGITIDSIERKIENTYREEIIKAGDTLNDMKRALEMKLHAAKNRKLARARLVSLKVNEMNTSINTRRTEDITKKIVRSNGQGYWV